MIEVISHAFASEHGGEAQIRMHLALVDHLIPALGLSNYELANLPHVSLCAHQVVHM